MSLPPKQNHDIFMQHGCFGNQVMIVVCIEAWCVNISWVCRRTKIMIDLCNEVAWQQSDDSCMRRGLAHIYSMSLPSKQIVIVVVFAMRLIWEQTHDSLFVTISWCCFRVKRMIVCCFALLWINLSGFWFGCKLMKVLFNKVDLAAKSW